MLQLEWINVDTDSRNIITHPVYKKLKLMVSLDFSECSFTFGFETFGFGYERKAANSIQIVPLTFDLNHLATQPLFKCRSNPSWEPD